MTQAPCFDGVVFDPFGFEENGLSASEINIGRCQIGDAFVIAQMIIVVDEVSCEPAEIICRKTSTKMLLEFHTVLTKQKSKGSDRYENCLLGRMHD